MSVEELEKSIREVWDLFKETDRKFKESQKELDKRSKETDHKIAEVSKAIADLGGKWGRFVDGLVAPGVARLFKKWGIVVTRVYPRARSYQNGKHMEIDVLAHNGDVAILIEVKSTLSIDDVNEHLQQLADFKNFFPEHAHRKVLGAVAGIVIEAGVDRYAYRQGLFVIVQSGETVKIVNDKKFKPQEW